MNPLMILQLVVKYWRYSALGILIAALCVQTYRLQGAQGEVAVFEEREQAMLLEQQEREHRNQLDKERTDAEYAAALQRARNTRVRTQPAVIVASQPPAAGSGDEPARCFSGGELRDRLADFANAHAGRLAEVATGISQRHAEAVDGIAARAEEVSAAYRACRSFVLNAE